uniref:Uncharacterized protein n=1 Tax=Arundo donax TaxID=35708 RepID=A0A0A9BKF9_ARUDO
MSQFQVKAHFCLFRMFCVASRDLGTHTNELTIFCHMIVVPKIIMHLARPSTQGSLHMLWRAYCFSCATPSAQFLNIQLQVHLSSKYFFSPRVSSSKCTWA